MQNLPPWLTKLTAAQSARTNSPWSVFCKRLIPATPPDRDWGYPRLVDILTGWAMPGRRGCPSACEEELTRLRREVAELRMDRTFLKRAAAFFATENSSRNECSR